MNIKFGSNNTVLYVHEQKLHWTEQKVLLKFILDAHAHAKYDYRVLAPFAWRVLLKYRHHNLFLPIPYIRN